MENKKEAMDKFYDFLMKESPDKGCMVCSVTEKRESVIDGEEKEITRYYTIEKRKVANGYMFIINGRFWYDYEWLYDHEWKILYKHYEE